MMFDAAEALLLTNIYKSGPECDKIHAYVVVKERKRLWTTR